MDKLISVIVPAYNTAEYIEEMLNCLERQTYENLQIIMVDDGSTDETASIIKRFACSDPRIEYYYQENCGVSAARNLGIEKIKGEKCFFIDSDDTFDSKLIEKCMDFAECNDVETVLFGYAGKKNETIGKKHIFELSGCYRGKEIETIIPSFIGHSYDDINAWIRNNRSFREGKEHTALWRIMLDSNTLLNSNMRFDMNLSIGEDTCFMNEYLLQTKSVGILNETLYYLTIRKGSANDTNNEDIQLMTENKLKLINARVKLDTIAVKSHNIDIHPYWQGTLVLSAVQLALKLSKDKANPKRENKQCYVKYINNNYVKKAIKNFKPYKGIKSIPFLMLKYLSGEIFFTICGFLPSKITSKFI